ncbi:MAG: hypothetical protein IPO42_10935 [Chitinophagaceae bacterium]|nr:hypothetical protein [Chitinophagaceae bacterium]
MRHLYLHRMAPWLFISFDHAGAGVLIGVNVGVPVPREPPFLLAGWNESIRNLVVGISPAKKSSIEFCGQN